MTRARRARGTGVLVLGEVLCDLFPPRAGVSCAAAETLRPLLGGAPANVAVQLARLGVRTALVSALGPDPLGERMRAALVAEGVDTSRVATRAGWRTGVTLVEVTAAGERTFFPLTERRADLSLTAADVVARHVRSFAAVHTGTVSLREAQPRAAHTELVRLARDHGLLVSLDVNLRWAMFRTPAELVRRARSALRHADVVKATADEARALLGSTSKAPLALARGLFDVAPRASLVLLTLDADGAVLATRDADVRAPACPVDVVDATGAGDAFVGAALAALLARAVPLEGLDRAALTAIGAQACAAGAAACEALGATTAMIRRLP